MPKRRPAVTGTGEDLQTNLDACFGLARQFVQKLPADAIGVKNEKLQVQVMPRGADFTS